MNETQRNLLYIYDRVYEQVERSALALPFPTPPQIPFGYQAPEDSPRYIPECTYFPPEGISRCQNIIDIKVPGRHTDQEVQVVRPFFSYCISKGNFIDNTFFFESRVPNARGDLYARNQRADVVANHRLEFYARDYDRVSGDLQFAGAAVNSSQNSAHPLPIFKRDINSNNPLLRPRESRILRPLLARNRTSVRLKIALRDEFIRRQATSYQFSKEKSGDKFVNQAPKIEENSEANYASKVIPTPDSSGASGYHKNPISTVPTPANSLVGQNSSTKTASPQIATGSPAAEHGPSNNCIPNDGKLGIDFNGDDGIRNVFTEAEKKMFLDDATNSNAADICIAGVAAENIRYIEANVARSSYEGTCNQVILPSSDVESVPKQSSNNSKAQQKIKMPENSKYQEHGIKDDTKQVEQFPPEIIKPSTSVEQESVPINPIECGQLENASHEKLSVPENNQNYAGAKNIPVLDHPNIDEVLLDDSDKNSSLPKGNPIIDEVPLLPPDVNDMRHNIDQKEHILIPPNVPEVPVVPPADDEELQNVNQVEYLIPANNEANGEAQNIPRLNLQENPQIVQADGEELQNANQREDLMPPNNPIIPEVIPPLNLQEIPQIPPVDEEFQNADGREPVFPVNGPIIPEVLNVSRAYEQGYVGENEDTLLIEEDIPTPFGLAKCIRIDTIDLKKEKETFIYDYFAQVEQWEAYSPFIPVHREAGLKASAFLSEFQRSSEVRDFVISRRDHINPNLLVYALTSTILHKKAYRRVFVPSMVEVLPHKFIPHEEIMSIYWKIQQNSVNNTHAYVHYLSPDFSGKLVDPDRRIAYWREDFGLNNFYWMWHVANPIDSERLKIDRKGELCYYMHQQMLARYDQERMCIGLPRVKPLDQTTWKDPIPEGYFSNLAVNTQGKMYGSRPDFTQLKGVHRMDYGLEYTADINSLRRWTKRIYEMIHRGVIFDEGGIGHSLKTPEQLNKATAMDIIGDSLVGDQMESMNFNYYGWLTYAGHALIAYAHDPDGRHFETIESEIPKYKSEMGVMGDPMAAARDPLFYRWHKFLDNLYQEHNKNKSPYTEKELKFPGIVIEAANVVRDTRNGQCIYNCLRTGYGTTNFDLTRGLDFATLGTVTASCAHLDHSPFRYEIQVRNNNKDVKMATVRIFLAPRYNDMNEELVADEQRTLWAEMDKFTIPLFPGVNRIARNSRQSSVICNTSYRFQDIECGKPMAVDSEYVAYPGCGWPEHLLLPRGSDDGMIFELFIMLTDWEVDSKVDIDNPPQESSADGTPIEKYESSDSDESDLDKGRLGCHCHSCNKNPSYPKNLTIHCDKDATKEKVKAKKPKNGGRREFKRTDCTGNAASYCGLRDSKYPDARPMGYPFDRKITPCILGQYAVFYRDYRMLQNVWVSDLTIEYGDHCLSQK